MGSLRVSKIFFGHAINENMMDELVNAGYSPIMLSGDIDVHIAIEMLELILEDKADIIAIVANNANSTFSSDTPETNRSAVMKRTSGPEGLVA